MLWTKRFRYTLERATKVLPQTAAEALFTIAGGKIKLKGIYGEVTTVIQTQANNTKLTFDPTVAGPSSTDMCAVLDITAKAVGSIFSIVGVVATAMKVTAGLIVVPANDIPEPGITLGPGSILLDCAASNTGSVKWTIEYELLDGNATVVVVN